MPLRLGRLLLVVGAIGLGGTFAEGAEPAPERLVTIGSDVTEIVFALGAGEMVVAVDSTSRYPEAADARPDLGYLRQLSAEPIIAMAPSLVLVSEEAGPPHVLEQLAAAGVALERITAEPSAAALDAKIEAIGRAIGREAEAAILRERVAVELERLESWTAGLAERPRTLLLIGIGEGRLMAAGAGSSGERIIELADGVNAVQGFAGYKPLSAEAALLAAPEVVVVPSHSLAILGGEAGIAALPQLAMTPAARDGRIVSIDSLLLLGFGPRLAEGAALLAAALHADPAAARPGAAAGNALN